MKKGTPTSSVRVRLRRPGRFCGRCPSWDHSHASHSEDFWEGLHMNLHMFTRDLGGRWNQSSGIRKLQVSVNPVPDLSGSPEEAPTPQILERLPHLQRQKCQSPHSLIALHLPLCFSRAEKKTFTENRI